jgi:uncharacterized protein
MQQKDERTWATFVHLAGIVGAMLLHSVGNIIAPLAIWLIKRNDSGFVNEEGKEALNFQLTIGIVNAIIGVLSAIRLGFWSINNMFRGYDSWDFVGLRDFSLFSGTHTLIWIINVIFSIIAAVNVSKGISYRYPVNLRLVK